MLRAVVFSPKTRVFFCIFKIFFVFVFTQPATGGENDLPPSAAKAAEYVHESFFDFKKFPQPVGETALQPAAFVATKPWRTPRFGEVKMKKRKWKIKNGKMELRSPHDTEAEAAADAAGRVGEAQRRAADVGADEPLAAAQQTVRTSRRSCGVGHAS